MLRPEKLEVGVRARLVRAERQIANTLAFVARGNPLGAEWEPQRLLNRLQAKALLSRDEAEAVARGIRGSMKPDGAQRELIKARGPEVIQGSTIDFISVAFLERGWKAAQAVARVAYLDGRPQGSGFMISDKLFMTNNHVISTKAEAGQFCIEFEYELDPSDRPRGPTRFALDPNTFFITDDQDDLDYTLIAVGERLSGPKVLQQFGFCPLSDARDKHALGEWANIVQHPQGRYKEVVLRENRLVSRLSTVLHYVADTEPGSSGSPVFNNEWQVIALHHWGGPWRQKVDDQGHPEPREVNEGIRASAIVHELKDKVGALISSQRVLLERAIRLGEGASGPASSSVPGNVQDGTDQAIARLDAEGRVTWHIPLEISVRLPQLVSGYQQMPTAAVAAIGSDNGQSGEGKVKPSTDYHDRSGYKPRFIDGFVVDLPRLTAAQKQIAARNKEAEPGDDPHELKYHHFSVFMNKRRKLAFFTACNIDGSRAKLVDRKTGQVSVLEPDNPDLESLGMPEGAEASETWYRDHRLNDEDYTDQALYDDQDVPGFPDQRSPARIARMFQRGHLVRRMDPAWGTEKQALLADADTFHFTNCSPQIGFFNMGTAAKLHLPETGGGRLWRAIENHVLRNAVAEKERVCSFTGPIFDDDNDIEWRSIKVPIRFWKIVVWAEGHTLRSLAMIADQKPVIDAIGALPEAAGDAEAFAEVGKVQDFLATVKEIEEATKLDFGAAVGQADIRAGEALRHVTNFEEIALNPSRRSPEGEDGRLRRGEHNKVSDSRPY